MSERDAIASQLQRFEQLLGHREEKVWRQEKKRGALVSDNLST